MDSQGYYAEDTIGIARNRIQMFSVPICSFTNKQTLTWASADGTVTIPLTSNGPNTQYLEANVSTPSSATVNATSFTSTLPNPTYYVPYLPVSLTPKSGPAGTIVTVQSALFRPNESITIIWNRVNPIVLGTLTTDNSGRFKMSVTLPSGAQSGQNVVYAESTSPPHRNIGFVF